MRVWKVSTTPQFDEWFTDVVPDSQAEVIAKVELLKVLGPQLGRPHADTLNGSTHANMKELRADTKDQVMRIAFAFDLDRSAILLVGGDKSGVGQKRFYKQLITKADELYDAHLAKVKASRKRKGT